LVGNHSLKDHASMEGKAGETVIFTTHTLTNTGAGIDTYKLTLADIGYPGMLSYKVDEETKEFSHGKNSNWNDSKEPEITLNPGESIELTYEVNIPITAPKEDFKNHKIIATSKSKSGQERTITDTITVIGIDYSDDSSKIYFDGITQPIDDSNWRNNWEISTFGPGQTIKLAALTSHDIDLVEAKIKVVGDGGGYLLNGGSALVIDLTEKDGPNSGKWETTYTLPSNLSLGKYFIEYYSYNREASTNPLDEDVTESDGAPGYNNYFNVASPNLGISLTTNAGTFVTSNEEVTLTMEVYNSFGETNAYRVYPKVTLPQGVKFVSVIDSEQNVVDAVYYNYSERNRELTFYSADKTPYIINKDEGIKTYFVVKTVADLSASEALNFAATTGNYYTAATGGEEKTEAKTYAALKTDTVSFTKTVDSTTNSGEDYVRPGDQVVYKVEIDIPPGLSINNLKLEELVNENLIIEKITVNDEEKDFDEDNTFDFNGEDKDLKILIFARVKDTIKEGTITATGTATVTWESKYTKDGEVNKKGSKTIEITTPIKEPRLTLDSFTTKDSKTEFADPGDEIEFTGKIKNNGSSKAHKTKVVAKLPEGVIPVEGSYGDGEYDESSNTITWATNVPANEEKIYTFKTKADSGKSIGSNATVVFELEEYYSSDNPDYTRKYTGEQKEISLTTTRDHAIEGTEDKDVKAGKKVVFEHKLTNKGGSYDEYEITVETDYPYELLINGQPPEKNHEGKIIVPLAPGEKVDIEIKVSVPETSSKAEKQNVTLAAKEENEDKTLKAQNIITVIGEDLDGWVSNALWTQWDKAGYKDNWKEASLYLGSPLKLSAITSIDITGVKARIVELNEDGEKGSTLGNDLILEELSLERVGELEDKLNISISGEFKLWDVTDYILEGLDSGRYFVEFAAFKNSTSEEKDETLTDKSGDLGYNNYFSIESQINLEGKITDAKENKPLEGATVTLLDLSGNPVKDEDGKEYTMVVGPDGKYEFKDVPIDRYILNVSHNKYKEYNRQVYVVPEPGESKVTIDAELIGFTIELKANPSTIVGDGKSKTILTARILDEGGEPVEGIEVTFEALLGELLGEPKDPKDPNTDAKEDCECTDKAKTNEKGEAYILYQSAEIEGIVSQVIPVKAEVDDKERGLRGEDYIFITFEPASIKGIVKDNKTGNAIEGAKIIVTLVDENGKLEFYAESVTNSRGEYKIAIPKKGNYLVEIIKPGRDDGQEVPSFKQTVNVTSIDPSNKDEEIPAIKTFTGVILVKDKDGNEKIAGKGEGENPVKIELLDFSSEDSGDNCGGGEVDSDTGVFSIQGLTPGVEYTFAITTEVDNETLVMGKIVVTLDDDGEIRIHEELIDPYGTIKDVISKQVLEGAHVELFYADTPRNTEKGRTPETSVSLPPMNDFAPADNDNPQWSDVNGNYAWMVFPKADYYIIATKAGYQTYDSRKDSNSNSGTVGNYYISVEYDIVKHDFEMQPIYSGGGGGSLTPPTDPEGVIVDLTSDKRSYLEETTGELEVEYFNNNGDIEDAQLVVTILTGATVEDPDGGTVEGGKITWHLGKLKGGDRGKRNPVIRFPLINGPEKPVTLEAQLYSKAKPIGEPSTIEVTIFSNRFGEGQHSRYIQGVPEGLFLPDKSITRAEIAVIFARILHLEDLVKHEKLYSDVETIAWYAKGVEAATKRKLFTGYEDGSFKPDQAITRAELAAVIARFLELPNRPPAKDAFKDTAGNWAENYIQELYRNNVVKGYEDGSFKPTAELRRSEAVTMINRMLNRGPLMGVEPSFPDVDKNHWAFGDVEESTRTHEYFRNPDGSETHLKTVDEDLFF